MDLEVGYAYRGEADTDFDSAVIEFFRGHGFSYEHHKDYDCWGEIEYEDKARVLRFIREKDD